MTKHAFRVGDKIRVVKQHPEWTENWVGTEGIITQINAWNSVDIKTTRLPPGMMADKYTGKLAFDIKFITLVVPEKPKKAKSRLEDLIL